MNILTRREYGIVFATGVAQARRRVPDILEDAGNGLTDRFRRWLNGLYEQLREWDRRIDEYDREIDVLFRADERCGRIAAIEGLGPVGATALVGAYGDARQFDSARQFSESLGLVPRQHTTGGKPKLLGISKRGDRYLRTLLIHGARSVVCRAMNKTDARSRWIQRLVTERGKKPCGSGADEQERAHHLGNADPRGGISIGRSRELMPEAEASLNPLRVMRRHPIIDKALQSRRAVFYFGGSGERL